MGWALGVCSTAAAIVGWKTAAVLWGFLLRLHSALKTQQFGYRGDRQVEGSPLQKLFLKSCRRYGFCLPFIV